MEIRVMGTIEELKEFKQQLYQLEGLESISPIYHNRKNKKEGRLYIRADTGTLLKILNPQRSNID